MRWDTRTVNPSCPSAGLRSVLLRTLALPIGFVVALAVGLAGLNASGLPADTVGSYPSAAQRLLDRHDCWSDHAPADMAGRLPGHAVVSLGAGAPHYSARMVGAALDHVFHGKHPALTVHGFCR